MTFSPGHARLLIIMGAFLMLVTVHRSGGSVMANALIGAGRSPSEVATIISAMFLASALFQLPTGMLFDRYGPRRTLFCLGLVAVVGIGLFATANSVLALSIGRVLIGIGHGGTVAGIYMLALTWVAPQRVATTTGSLIALAGGLGSALATTPLVLSLDAFGHRDTFVVVAILSLAVTLAIGLFVRDAPPGDAPVRGEGESFVESLRGLWQVATDTKLWPIFAMGSCFSLPFNALGGLWAGPYLSDVHRMSDEQASVGVLAMVVCFHLGNLLYGPVERATRTRKWTVAAGVLAMIVFLSVLASWSGFSSLAAITLLALVCLCAPFYPVLAAHCRGFVPLGRAGRAIACVNLVGLGIVFLFQTLSGWLIEFTASAQGEPTLLGYRLVFASIALMLVLGVLGYLRARDVPP